MEHEKNEVVDLLNSQLKTVDAFRKQLSEGISVTLTEAEHYHLFNHLANTLVAFKLFLFTDNKDDLKHKERK